MDTDHIDDRFEKLEKRISKLENRSITTIGYTAGIVSAFTFIGAVIALLWDWIFNH